MEFPEERQEFQKRKREELKKFHNDENIKNSDYPDVINSLFNNYESQALFVGNLDPNSIRAIWISPNFKITPEIQTFKRISPKQFLKKYKELDLRKDKKNFKIFKPREKFDLDVLIYRIQKNYNMSKEQILKILKTIDLKSMKIHLWDHQLAEFEKIQKKL